MQTPQPYSAPVVLVTGASRGIGAATALAFGRAGWRVRRVIGRRRGRCLRPRFGPRLGRRGLQLVNAMTPCDTTVRRGNAASGNGAKGRNAIGDRGSLSPGVRLSSGESSAGGGFGLDP